VLASTDADGVLKIWDAASGRELRTLPKLGNRLAFSAGGALAVAGDRIGILDFGRIETYRQFERSLPAAWAAIRTNPKDPAALNTIGQWYAFRGLDGWAIDLLESARAGGADVPSLELSRCYVRSGANEKAVREFRKALDRHEAPDGYLNDCLAGFQ
jgi:hypothetical protein